MCVCEMMCETMGEKRVDFDFEDLPDYCSRMRACMLYARSRVAECSFRRCGGMQVVYG